MDPSRYQTLQTPCMVIDHQAALRNIRRMQAVADQNGVALRPHIKTHKMPFYARLQVAAGAKGITCAKVSEAEVMADGGIDDIFIAYPLVGAFRMERALALLPKCQRLILAVDSLAGARALNDFALARGVVFEVRMEVDTGARRTGVALERAVDLALALRAMEGLRLTGVYTFKSMLLHGDCCTDRDAAGAEEGALLRGLQTALGRAGVHLADVSAGSTPTGEAVARTGAVTESRPGTYIFNAQMVCCEGAAPGTSRPAMWPRWSAPPARSTPCWTAAPRCSPPTCCCASLLIFMRATPMWTAGRTWCWRASTRSTAC